MTLENTIKAIKNAPYAGDIESAKLLISCKYPFTLKALHEIDKDYTQPKRRKGFNLIFRNTKKHGRRIYGRLSYNGKILPTKFCTYTNNEYEAEKYLLLNKEKLIKNYFARKDGKMYKYLENFYESQTDLPEKTRISFGNKVKYKFIPFLKQERITHFGQITKHLLNKFQKLLRETGMDSGTNDKRRKVAPYKPQSVNNITSVLKRIFEKLEKDKEIENNPFDLFKTLKVPEFERKERSCHEIENITSGVFIKRWTDELSYILCLIIYTTGMRNNEISGINLNSIRKIGGLYFISINKSKTKNGVRLIPLHERAYRTIKAYAAKRNKKEDELLFPKSNHLYSAANIELGRRLKMSRDELKKENITFYSGRHFWKTLMSAEGLGEDIEEIWMGHSVTKSVKRLYNHKDKIGRKRMLKKAKKMMEILGRCIFLKSNSVKKSRKNNCSCG